MFVKPSTFLFTSSRSKVGWAQRLQVKHAQNKMSALNQFFYCFAAWSVASWCRWYYGSLSPVSQTSQLSSGLCTRSETARQWKVRWKELWIELQIRLSGVYFSQRKSAMCASAQTVNFKASSSYIKVVYRFLLLFLYQAQFKGASWRSFCGGDQDCQLPRFDLYDSQRKVRVCSVSKYSHILPFWPWSGDISRASYLMQVFARRTLR